MDFLVTSKFWSTPVDQILKIVDSSKNRGKKTTIFTRGIKGRGIFAKKGLGRWYGLQNTFRGCTFIQFNTHLHILHGCRKIDFWKFEIFGILGNFLLYFCLKSASKRYFCMFKTKLNTKIHVLESIRASQRFKMHVSWVNTLVNICWLNVAQCWDSQ